MNISISREEFEAKKEVPRFPQCPVLTELQIKEITETVFPLTNPQPADILFIFGSSRDDEWQQVAGLFLKGLAPVAYIGGGIGGRSFDAGRPLSHLIRDDLVSFGVPFETMIVDEKSANTLEDALFGRELFETRGILHKRILFACKWPHGGRCLRTLRKVFPDSELFPFMYDFKYEGRLITQEIREHWWRDEQSRSFVWGEYQRILLYSGRGDIST